MHLEPTTKPPADASASAVARDQQARVLAAQRVTQKSKRRTRPPTSAREEEHQRAMQLLQIGIAHSRMTTPPADLANPSWVTANYTADEIAGDYQAQLFFAYQNRDAGLRSAIPPWEGIPGTKYTREWGENLLAAARSSRAGKVSFLIVKALGKPLGADERIAIRRIMERRQGWHSLSDQYSALSAVERRLPVPLAPRCLPENATSFLRHSSDLLIGPLNELRRQIPHMPLEQTLTPVELLLLRHQHPKDTLPSRPVHENNVASLGEAEEDEADTVEVDEDGGDASDAEDEAYNVASANVVEDQAIRVMDPNSENNLNFAPNPEQRYDLDFVLLEKGCNELMGDIRSAKRAIEEHANCELRQAELARRPKWEARQRKHD
ncbi:hypothetical protein R3P38DRAFT_3196759 [Favolaschia claudopus]|uniref:Uncharacterized protein n=1 Tax=Favolaschia claudopus TaxID=2862362 RepID=A0AAW0B8P1_9AGAR